MHEIFNLSEFQLPIHQDGKIKGLFQEDGRDETGTASKAPTTLPSTEQALDKYFNHDQITIISINLPHNYLSAFSMMPLVLFQASGFMPHHPSP